MLAPFIGDLDRIAPSYQINGSQIQVLKTPSEFYETLKVWPPWSLKPISRRALDADRE